MKIKIHMLVGFGFVFGIWILFGISFIGIEEENPIKTQIDHLNSPNPTHRLIATANLISFGDEALPLLLKAIEGEDLQIKIEAIQVLGYIGNPIAVDPLIKLLEHDYWKVRYFSINALGQLDSEKIIPTLKSIIGNDEDERVEMWALLSLGKRKDFDDIEFLKSGLKSQINMEGFNDLEFLKIVSKSQINNQPHFHAAVNDLIKKIESGIPREKVYETESGLEDGTKLWGKAIKQKSGEN